MTEQTQPRDHGKYSFKQQSEASVALAAPEDGERKYQAKLVALEAEIDGELQDAEPSNYEEDNFDAGYIRGLTYAQNAVRGALTATEESSGQTSPSSIPTVPGTAHQLQQLRAELARVTRAMDETLVNSTAASVREIFPGAKELRMRQRSIGSSDGRMTPSFVRTANDEFLGARFDKSGNANWASRTIDGSDPGSIEDALNSISAHSDIWDTDPRCDYDPQTEEHIIYLDGRRRHES